VPHLQDAEPRLARAAAPASPRAEAARGGPLRRLDSAAVQDEPEQRPPAGEEGFGHRYQPRLYLRLLLIGLVAAYAIAFVLENDSHVHVHFVFGTARISQIWLILLSVGLGLVLGVLLSQLYRRRRRRRD
jgi:uncharacterized integral membrane protein